MTTPCGAAPTLQSQNWPGIEPITEKPKLCGALTADLAHSADTDMEAVCSGAHARRFAEPSRPTAPPHAEGRDRSLVAYFTTGTLRHRDPQQ